MCKLIEKKIAQVNLSFSPQKWQSQWDALDQQHTFIWSYSISSLLFSNHELFTNKGDRGVTRFLKVINI
jgi:hypothetical protein